MSAEQQPRAPMRVNLGSGQAYMEGWVNVDPDPSVKADVHAEGIEFVRAYALEIDEVYLGHVLEHLLPGDAYALLALLSDRLRPGVLVSAVVPDMKAIFAAYQAGEISNDELNLMYVYSYVQPSHHVWCYDADSLAALFARAGLDAVEPIDPLTWPPVYWKEGPDSRWQCGVRARARGRLSSEDPVLAATGPEGDKVAAAARHEDMPQAGDQAGEEAGEGRPVLVDVLERNRSLRDELRLHVELRRQLEVALAQANRSNEELHALARHLTDIQSSPQYREAQRLLALARRAFPAGSPQRSLAEAGRRSLRAARVLQRLVPGRSSAGHQPPSPATAGEPPAPEPAEPAYGEWCSTHDVGPAEWARQVQESTALGSTNVGVVVVVCEGHDDVDRTIGSLVNQSAGRWRAVVAVPAGMSLAATRHDHRVQRIDLPSPDPRHLLNPAVEALQEVDFLVFLEAGDELAPDCLYQVASAARRDPLVDLVYWDDDLLDDDGNRHDPRFRPAWSPATLLAANYVGWAFAIRNDRYRLCGAARDELGSAMLWDVLLRSGLDGERVERVPRVLSHVRRRHEEVDDDGRRAVADHLARSGAVAEVEAAGSSLRVRWALEAVPHVTVIVPTRHNRRMAGPCLRSLATTEYPSFDVVVVDNGERRPDNEAWYESFGDLDLTVAWWDEPFNYSKVNNHAAARARGDVLVFLNDDTEVLERGWMQELVGWLGRPGVGVVGLQLVDGTGAIQHAGAVVGMNGFADHVFQGMPPASSTLLGRTDWYREVTAVTGACLAITHDRFDEIGGFDERFLLCGSDVALCLEAGRAGGRTVCSSLVGLRHLESATRGTEVPAEDFFTSYWRYQSVLFGGDPYFSPNLSLESRVPQLRWPSEPSPADRLELALGRRVGGFRQGADRNEAVALAHQAVVSDAEVRAVRHLHQANAEPFSVRTVNWYVPDIESPSYGGVNTVLRIADHLRRHHGVENRFVVLGTGPEGFVRSALATAFPSLAHSPIAICDGTLLSLDEVPAADVSIATLWLTAYAVARATRTRRKFYAVQDFEPMFYPAGTLYALAEETYRMGLYGIMNTANLLEVYRGYGGSGTAFTPAVDPSVFHSQGRRQWHPGAPVTVFLYSRPGHWRNCWELASVAMAELKRRLGDRVRIVAAGSATVPDGNDLMGLRNLGLLDYRATGDLYRRCDVGVALTVSKHPSYLPLELMACGVPVVAFDNPYGHWILRHEHNGLLARRTVPSLVDAVERLVVDHELRQRLSQSAVADIERDHAGWEPALAGIYAYLCDPEGRAAGA